MRPPSEAELAFWGRGENITPWDAIYNGMVATGASAPDQGVWYHGHQGPLSRFQAAELAHLEARALGSELALGA